MFGVFVLLKELATKLAYLLTETPDVNRCMSVSAPSIVRRRKKPSTIFAPNKAMSNDARRGFRQSNKTIQTERIN